MGEVLVGIFIVLALSVAGYVVAKICDRVEPDQYEEGDNE